MLVLMADRLAISVGDLFLGALFPGILLGALYVVYILLHAWVRPADAPLPADVESVDRRILLDVLRAVLPAAALILAVLRRHSLVRRAATRTRKRMPPVHQRTLFVIGSSTLEMLAVRVWNSAIMSGLLRFEDSVPGQLFAGGGWR